MTNDYHYTAEERRVIEHVANLMAAASRQDSLGPVIGEIDVADFGQVVNILTTSAWTWLLGASNNNYDAAALKIEAFRRIAKKRRR